MVRTWFLSLLLALIPSYAFCIEIWHSDNIWIGQGYSSYSFTLDGQDLYTSGGATDLKITIDMYEKGEKTGSETIVIEKIGSCNAERYDGAAIETQANPDKFVISKASAIIDGERVDLLKSGMLTWREFSPVPIEIQK